MLKLLVLFSLLNKQHFTFMKIVIHHLSLNSYKYLNWYIHFTLLYIVHVFALLTGDVNKLI